MHVVHESRTKINKQSSVPQIEVVTLTCEHDLRYNFRHGNMIGTQMKTEILPVFNWMCPIFIRIILIWINRQVVQLRSALGLYDHVFLSFFRVQLILLHAQSVALTSWIVRDWRMRICDTFVLGKKVIWALSYWTEIPCIFQVWKAELLLRYYFFPLFHYFIVFA